MMQWNFYSLEPTKGFVLEVSLHCYGTPLQLGYCRSAVFGGPYVYFHGSFVRCSDPGLFRSWAESRDFGFLPREFISFNLIPEARWMQVLRSNTVI